MLYVKVDDQGNPLENAKTFEEVKSINLMNNTIIPERFKYAPEEFGYRPVPANVPKPDEIAGKTVMSDVPVKNADGSYTRTWKYADIPGYAMQEDEMLDRQLRAHRKSYLLKFADSISPLRWEKWSEEEKQVVRDWYDEVLNMPNDPAWPRMVLPPLPTPIKGSGY